MLTLHWLIIFKFQIKYSKTPIIRNLVIRNSDYPDRLESWGKYVENSTKLTCLEITGYRIKYSSVMASRTSNQAWSKGLDADRVQLKCDGTR